LPNGIKVPHILFLENDGNDAILIGIAMKAVDPPVRWFICRNPSEARSYLKGTGMYSDRKKYPLPDAIVSDLKMGSESGADFVCWLRTRKEFNQTPVLIFSGCASPEEMKQAEELGAQEVLRKPIKVEDLRRLFQKLVDSVRK